LRATSDNDLLRFRDIHGSVELANVWKYAKSSRMLKNIFAIVKLMTDIPNNTKGICVYVTDSFLTYVFMPVVVVLQKTWWDMIIEHFNLDLYFEISQYDNEIKK